MARVTLTLTLTLSFLRPETCFVCLFVRSFVLTLTCTTQLPRRYELKDHARIFEVEESLFELTQRSSTIDVFLLK
ncbi:hypothetical protein VNO78_14481 [Psophocarpus tetragonolobus]|uniref:Uncharacterized protein n=1 Tax=Psophocarpus tetragonolobus TaxID=3891 RepID=A0AAN9XQE4_PSOTE